MSKKRPYIGSENNFGITFKLHNSDKGYNIFCHMIERGDYIEQCCVSGIQNRMFAKYIFEAIQNRWNLDNEILIFSDENIGQDSYHGLFKFEELSKFEKLYQELRDLDYENSEKPNLETLKKDVARMIRKMEIFQEKMEMIE